MRKVYVCKFSIYNDGDWGLDTEILKKLAAYKSKYYENDLYEQTDIDFDDLYSYKFKRVFDSASDCINFVRRTFSNLHGRDYEINEMIPEFIDNLINEFNHNKNATDFIDGNTEIEASMYSIETDAKKIKQIIYED